MFGKDVLAGSPGKVLATSAVTAVIAVGLAVPSAQAAASATLAFDFPAEVVVGDTVIAQLKVTNTGDKALKLTALRAVLACEVTPTAALCTSNEERRVFEVRKAETTNSACEDTTFRPTQTGNRVVLEPVSNLGDPVSAATLKPNDICTVNLTLAVRAVPAKDADGDAGIQTKAGAVAALRNTATTPPTILAPDDLNEVVTVDRAPGDEPVEEEPVDEDPTDEAPPVTCQGVKATIVGTRSGDTLKGTSGRDVIAGLGGGDIINGGGGRDLICGGSGEDTLRGSTGADTLSGGSGNDAINGGDGADDLAGGGGNDRLNGASGSDDLFGGPGNDKLVGGPGNDRIVGGSGTDRGEGGPGTDTFSSTERRKA
ncbi:MAG: calcium-binding protein [Sporichthyaceae bacterium]